MKNPFKTIVCSIIYDILSPIILLINKKIPTGTSIDSLATVNKGAVK